MGCALREPFPLKKGARCVRHSAGIPEDTLSGGSDCPHYIEMDNLAKPTQAVDRHVLELIKAMQARYNDLSAQISERYERLARDVDARLNALAADVNTINERLTELSDRIKQEQERKA